MRLTNSHRPCALLAGSVLALLFMRLAMANDPAPKPPAQTAQTATATNASPTKRNLVARQEAPLSESAKAALPLPDDDRPVPVLNFKSGPENGHKWLFEMSKRLEERIPDRKQRTELLITVHYEAISAGLDPQLVLALIQVKSGFRKYAVSDTGARGYMQVKQFWIKAIGEPHHNLFALRTNLRYGCVILRHYLDIEKGDTIRALNRYNGGEGKRGFAALVQDALRTRWAYDGPTS